MSRYLAYDPVKDTLHTGLCHLNGIAAYSYCRMRESDDDWNRQERVREVVSAMVAKLKDLSIKDMNNIADTVLPMISTNLSKAEIRALMAMAPKFINAEVTQLMIPEQQGSWTYITGRGAHMLGCDYAACAKEIKEFIYG
jgi:anionic cell wall polymer biosynthesis LytR-Cps2A-Psr (LCP) family protein